MKTIKSLTLLMGLCVVVLFAAGCGDKNELPPVEPPPPVEEPIDLTDTKWELNGIVDAQTGKLTELEPKSCKECYSLTFDADGTTVRSFTSIGSLKKEYEVDYTTNTISMSENKGSLLDESHADGPLFWSILPTVQSFSYKNGELRLYYNDKKEYLSYRPYDAVKSVAPIQIAKGNLSGSGNVEKQNTVITTKADWAVLLAKMSTPNPMPSLGEIDFEQYQVIAVIDVVRTTGGWSIDITDITEHADKIVVTYSNLNTGDATAVVTQPYHIVRIPKSDKVVEFIDNSLLSAETPVPITPIQMAKGNLSGSEGVKKQNTVITATGSEWDDFAWPETALEPASESIKDVDFEQYQVVVVVDDVHHYKGWSIDITNVAEYSDKIVVTYSNLNHGNDEGFSRTQPYHIVKIPKSEKKVEFVDNTPVVITENSVWKCFDYEKTFDFVVEIVFYPSEGKLQLKTTPEVLGFPIMLGSSGIRDYYIIGGDKLYLKSADIMLYFPWNISFLSENEIYLSYGGTYPTVAEHPYLTLSYRFIRQTN